jgi:hypothetical protein
MSKDLSRFSDLLNIFSMVLFDEMNAIVKEMAVAPRLN